MVVRRCIVLTPRASMRTALAFRLPNGVFEQCDGQLIEDKLARLKCDVSSERASVGIKTQLTRRSRRLAHPY
jgi:hypothetical protein